MTGPALAPAAPEFSVVVGLASTVERERILDLLAALEAEAGGPSFEVLLADRRQDEVSAQIRDRHPQVVLLPAPPGTSLPELRALALGRARGRFVVVTEDHCVPEAGWLAGFAHAFASAPAEVVAVGGAVVNGAGRTALDRATFLCEYGPLLPPLRDGPALEIAGMNVAYRREALAGAGDARLASGFWETVVHPLLLAAGHRFLVASAIRVRHCKPFGLAHFCSQRFLYSRCYGAWRHRSWPARLAVAAGFPILGLFTLARQGRRILARPGQRRDFVLALPWLAAFHLIGAAGEAVGALGGPGDAPGRIE